MTGLELVASAVTKAVVSRALANTPIGGLVRPAFRIYSMFDMMGALAECAELAVHDERVEEEDLCGFSASDLSEKIGQDVISVTLEKGLTTISAPRMSVYSYSFSHDAAWKVQKSRWSQQRDLKFDLEKRWDAKTRSWK